MPEHSVAILLATKGRWTRLRSIINNLLSTTGGCRWTLHFCVEDNDPDTYREVVTILFDFAFARVSVSSGRTSNTAYNQGFRDSDEEFIYVAGDDMEFSEGWLTKLLDIVDEEKDSDPPPSVISTWDGCFADGKSGYLVRRSYVESFGLIDKPGQLFYEYGHCFADTELYLTALKRRVYRESSVLVRHHHYTLSDRFKQDATALVAEACGSEDETVFNSRRHLFQ